MDDIFFNSLKNGEVDYIVFTKDQCTRCNMTKKVMDNRGIIYSSYNIQHDDAALDAMNRVKPADALSAPVVVSRSDVWGGFRPDRIK